jgi:hypothetical protein
MFKLHKNYFPVQNKKLLLNWGLSVEIFYALKIFTST